MNKLANHPIRHLGYPLLLAMIIPLTANASVVEQVTLEGQPLATETGACLKTTDIDLLIQRINRVKKRLATKATFKAEKSLKQIYHELEKLDKTGYGTVTEQITVTHGPRMVNSAYINTDNAYYSSDMQDMRLLRMAQSHLKAGNSQAACSELSAVRFPYVSASAQLPILKSSTQAHLALSDLQLNDFQDAKSEVNRIPVYTGSYASIVQQ